LCSAHFASHFYWYYYYYVCALVVKNTICGRSVIGIKNAAVVVCLGIL